MKKLMQAILSVLFVFAVVCPGNCDDSKSGTARNGVGCMEALHLACDTCVYFLPAESWELLARATQANTRSLGR